MWKSIKNKFESGDIHPDCTRSLVNLMGSDQPQLFYHREQPKDGNRYDIYCNGDILVGIRVPHVDTRSWKFSPESNSLKLRIDNQSVPMRIQTDKNVYLIDGTHPLVFLGHKFIVEIVASSSYPYIDFIWCHLHNEIRLNLAPSKLIYHVDNNIMVSEYDKTTLLNANHHVKATSNNENDAIVVPNLASAL